jgi:3-phenylpropionate/cinnamic acid dioxygenase small subunit
MNTVSTELYQEIQHFYARQMQQLDAGLADEWAATFTEDGVFEANAHPEPSIGRAVISAAVKQAHGRLAEMQETRRHWLGMLTIDRGEDGTLFVRSYAMIVGTKKGGEPKIVFSTLCEDTLVRHEDGWQVKYRKVTRDDL